MKQGFALPLEVLYQRAQRHAVCNGRYFAFLCPCGAVLLEGVKVRFGSDNIVRYFGSMSLADRQRFAVFHRDHGPHGCAPCVVEVSILPEGSAVSSAEVV